MTQLTDERRFARPSQTTTTVTADAVEHAIRHTTLRALGFGGMLGIALIHLLDVIGKIKETPYLGVMYIALMVASVAVALSLLHTGSSLAWGAAGLLAVATLTGFVLSRTTGLPHSEDDIGNWTEGLGLASMFVEGAVIVLSGYALALARRERRPGIHASVARRVSASSGSAGPSAPRSASPIARPPRMPGGRRPSRAGEAMSGRSCECRARASVASSKLR